ncbi:MAG: amino acid adenylation domain-containing protein, partial [Burkholderiales bacterium]|nr:amino acid adenylation domain-containing protein [Burkholderiales bacterium]
MANDGPQDGSLRNEEVRGRLAALTPAQRALLERRLEEKSRTAAGDQHIAKRNGTEPAPLSFAQQRLWFLDQFDPGGSFYNIPLALQLDGVLDIAALRATLSEIVRRHETLRTTFVAKSGEPVQLIHAAAEVPLPVTDLSELPQAERGNEAAKLQSEEAKAPFDLAAGPLIRARLLRLAESSHVLLVTMHHIISDGWSIGILLREIGVLYGDKHAGRPSSLSDLPLQYADFAIWQRASLQGQKLEKQLAYWRTQLAGSPPLSGLASDRPRPAVQNFRGARLSGKLSKSLCEALQQLARREKATLFMVLLAAFQTLLHRYTRSDDIVVGSPIAGRTNAGIEHLIGFFVNTLALRTDLSGNPTFRQLLGRVRDVALGAYAHHDLPFEKLVEELNPERSLSYPPLFQVMFALQNIQRAALEIPGLEINPLPSAGENAKFDLSLSVIESAESARVIVEYNTDLFDAATATRLLAHYETLLHGISINPEYRLSDLPLLTGPERQQLLVDWNDTETYYPKDRCIHDLFEAQVDRTPDAVAVVFGEQQLSYAELNARANRLAHHLIALGVGPEVLVGLCVERSLEMIVGLLGILKAGGAYLPLDPAYPKERLAFMLEDSKAPVLITESRLDLPEHAAQCLFVDQAAVFDRYPAANPETSVGSDHLAYVIYTSGSTGKPKGVMIGQRAISRHAAAMRDYYRMAAGDRVLQFAALSFDVSAEEIFSTLLSGAASVLQTESMPGSLADFLSFAQRQGLSVIGLPTAYWNTWVDDLERATALPTKLRLLIVGNEKVSAERFALWRATFGARVRLINAYGPTEATITATCYEAGSAPVDREAAAVPIGRPVANKHIYILDPHLNPTPIGVPGELCIGGTGLARGYLNRPELTAEKFIPNPFSDVPGSRLYRTGDLARYLPDGNIEFLGRIDHQVKIRG